MKTRTILSRLVVGVILTATACQAQTIAQTSIEANSEDKKYYQDSKRGWGFQVSATPVFLSPSESFYRGLNSSVGGSVGVRLHRINNEGKVDGWMVGLSYQIANLRYETQPGSVRSAITSLEFGRAFSLSQDGSYFYTVIGISSLDHKGEAPRNNRSSRGYEEGSRPGLKLKFGLATFLTKKLGLDFGVGFDAVSMRTFSNNRINYSDKKFDGILLGVGVGVLYRL